MEMWTSLQSTYPTTSGDQYIDGILDIDKPSYNFELPFEGNTIVYTFEWYDSHGKAILSHRAKHYQAARKAQGVN